MAIKVHLPARRHWTRLNPMQLIEKSQKGIHGRELKAIQEETGFSTEDWARYLQVATRTIQRYLQENTRIDSALTERALLVAQIAERGRNIFGTEERFKLWLNTPSMALGGKSPNTLLDTTTGMHLVAAELTGIEHGAY